jgi:hypothetical protein
VSETVISRDTFYVPLQHKNLDATSFIIKDASGNVVNPSLYRLDATNGRIRGEATGNLPRNAVYTVSYSYFPIFASARINNEDDNPVFDGMKVFVEDAPLGIDSSNSGWVVRSGTNLVGITRLPVQALTTNPFRPAPIDVQIRWNRTDTSATGKWLFPGDTLLNNFGAKVVVCPFRIVDVTDTSSVRVLVNRATGDSVWRPDRELVFITPPKFSPSQSPVPVLLSVTFAAPEGQRLVLPTAGDIYEARTTKPFVAGDQFSFTTTASKFDAGTATSALDQICVVPNPYVAYSKLEQPGSTSTRRGETKLQFRNLPPKCTIRIYTLIGELVDTIVKDDRNSYADWQLLSYEGNRLAYGVYIYHVDVPGVGQKIGRFALIK